MIGEAVADALKPLATISTAVAELQKGQQALQESVKGAATAETVNKAVSDTLAAQQAGQAKSAARAAYIAEKMKDVPAELLGTLSDDPAKFAADEQAIRGRLESIKTALGVKTPDVGGSAGGQAASAQPDLTKLSGTALIAMAVKAGTTAGQPVQAAKAVEPAKAAEAAK